MRKNSLNVINFSGFSSLCLAFKRGTEVTDVYDTDNDESVPAAMAASPDGSEQAVGQLEEIRLSGGRFHWEAAHSELVSRRGACFFIVLFITNTYQ